MDENQFSVLLSLIVPQIITLIEKNSNIDEQQVVSIFYKSKLYRELSCEETKLWHYSPLTLYTMYQDELLTGSYEYPEGVS